MDIEYILALSYWVCSFVNVNVITVRVRETTDYIILISTNTFSSVNIILLDFGDIFHMAEYGGTLRFSNVIKRRHYVNKVCI